jgi:hypothetical protein
MAKETSHRALSSRKVVVEIFQAIFSREKDLVGFLMNFGVEIVLRSTAENSAFHKKVLTTSRTIVADREICRMDFRICYFANGC